MPVNDLTGKNAYLAFQGTQISSDFREFSESEEIGLEDASAGSDVARTYITTLEDGTATLTILMQADATATTDPWNLMDVGQEGTLEWGPEGTATGKARHYVNAIVQSRDKTMPYDNLIEMSFGLQFSGVVTDVTY